MFSFFKKIAKSFLGIFKKSKKEKVMKKPQMIFNKFSSFIGVFKPNEQKIEQKNPDILKEISLLILKEFGFGKYINFALGFAKLLK